MTPETISTRVEVNTCGLSMDEHDEDEDGDENEDENDHGKGGISDDVISLVTSVVIDVIVVNN